MRNMLTGLTLLLASGMAMAQDPRAEAAQREIADQLKLMERLKEKLKEEPRLTVAEVRPPALPAQQVIVQSYAQPVQSVIIVQQPSVQYLPSAPISSLNATPYVGGQHPLRGHPVANTAMWIITFPFHGFGPRHLGPHHYDRGFRWWRFGGW